jgi:uncharacterized protein YdaU (DUF1376 family)
MIKKSASSLQFPSMPLYPMDFLMSTAVEEMDAHEFRAYMLLLMRSWVANPPCFLKNSSKFLKKISKLSTHKWNNCSTSLLKNFKEKDGYIYNERLLNEYNLVLQRHKNKRDAGIKGGRPVATRSGPLIKPQVKHSLSNAKPEPNLSETLSKDNSNSNTLNPYNPLCEKGPGSVGGTAQAPQPQLAVDNKASPQALDVPSITDRHVQSLSDDQLKKRIHGLFKSCGKDFCTYQECLSWIPLIRQCGWDFLIKFLNDFNKTSDKFPSQFDLNKAWNSSSLSRS